MYAIWKASPVSRAAFLIFRGDIRTVLVPSLVCRSIPPTLFFLCFRSIQDHNPPSHHFESKTLHRVFVFYSTKPSPLILSDCWFFSFDPSDYPSLYRSLPAPLKGMVEFSRFAFLLWLRFVHKIISPPCKFGTTGRWMSRLAREVPPHWPQLWPCDPPPFYPRPTSAAAFSILYPSSQGSTPPLKCYLVEIFGSTVMELLPPRRTFVPREPFFVEFLPWIHTFPFLNFG